MKYVKQLFQNLKIKYFIVKLYKKNPFLFYLLLFIFIIFLFDFNILNNYSISNIKSFKQNNGNFISFGENIIRFNNNKIFMITPTGETLFTKNVNFFNPIFNQSKNMLIAYNKNGNKIYLFNKKRMLPGFLVNNKIAKAYVTDKGTVAVILKNNYETKIGIYNKKGELLALSGNLDNSTQKLVDIAISPNSKYLILSYLITVNNKIKSKIVYYSFKNVKNKIIFQKIYKNTIIPHVSFMDNNTVVAYGDNKLVFLNNFNNKINSKQIRLKYKIRSIANDNKYVVIILEKSLTTYSNNIILIYDKKGKINKNIILNNNYTDMYVQNSKIILYNNNYGQIIKLNDGTILDIKFKEDILKLLEINSMSNYVLITNNKMLKIKIN